MRSSVVAPRPSSSSNGQTTYYQPQVGVRWNPQGPLPPQPARPPKRSSTRYRSFAPAEGWLALILLVVAVYSVVYSIISAQWVDHTFILFWSTAVGLLLGLLVAKIRPLPQVIMHLGACLLGHWLSIWLTSAIAYHISWLLLLGTLRTAITDGFGTGMTPGSEMVFLFYLSFLCFFLGYLGSWLTYRAHLPWLVALAYCSIMLVNLNYVKQDLSFLVLILLGALVLLIARIQLVTQLAYWTSEGLHTDRPWLRNLINRVMRFASLLTLLVLIVSWISPMRSEPSAAMTFWDRLDNTWMNVIHGNFSVQDPGSITLPYQAPATFFGDQLAITGNVRLPSGEVLSYTGTALPQYLEGFTYDHFDGHTWTSSVSTSYNFGAKGQLPGNAVPEASRQIITEITITQPPGGTKHYIFGPAEPLSFSVPVTVYGGDTPAAWVKQGPLSSGEHYQVISNSILATAESLSEVPLPQNDQGTWQADSNYTSLSTYYLQVPVNLSDNVEKTTLQWTQDSTNAYEALQKLVSHLSDRTQFTYSVTNPPVPNNVDAVTWLLQTKQGYCTYYATAMTIMARLLGIPARIANGFSHGHFDAQHHAWIVNGDDAHSWVQAYFPGFGWINFDPTPGFSSSNISNPTPKVTTTPTPSIKSSPTVRAVTPAPKKGSHTPQNLDPGSTPGARTPAAIARENLLVGLTIATLLCSFLVLLAAICTYWWRNLYRNASFVSGMYWRICRAASWAGLPPLGSQTPYEYSAMLSRNVPAQTAAPLRRLTDLFVRERWAPTHHAPHPAEQADLERLQPRLRALLLQLFLRRFRRR